jgi:nucleoside-diphosphate-sugar epimerase
MTAAAIADQTILVTGGAGFVGSQLVRHLLALGAGRIVIVDNLLSSERINVPGDRRVTFFETSAADDALLASLRDEFDYAFHLSTFHGNQNSIADPLADHANNTLPTLKLFERLRHFGRVKKIVYSGAGCALAEKTFDDAHATEESDLVSLHNNDSPYSMSKIFGEFYSAYYFKQFNLPVVRARFQNVYGPGEYLGAGRWRGTPATVWRNVTPTFIYKALDGQRLPLENEGIATRDFIYVDDVARGLVACAVSGRAGEAYNVASGVETSIRELATRIIELTGNTAGLELLPRRSWDHSGKRFGSTKKSERELGWTAQVSLDEGLSRTVAWTRANLDTIRGFVRRYEPEIRDYHAAHARA